MQSQLVISNYRINRLLELFEVNMLSASIAFCLSYHGQLEYLPWLNLDHWVLTLRDSTAHN